MTDLFMGDQHTWAERPEPSPVEYFRYLDGRKFHRVIVVDRFVIFGACGAVRDAQSGRIPSVEISYDVPDEETCGLCLRDTFR